MALEADIAVPLPDGTVLRGDLYRPEGVERFPVLLAWAGYTRELHAAGVPLPFNEVGVIPHLVGRGYGHLTLSPRGSGRSQGEHDFFFSPAERRDVADAIRWIGNQRWCDGTVGMVGMSYFAIIQYHAAAEEPEPLKAIFPYLAFTDLYHHGLYHAGMPQTEWLAAYIAFHGSTQGLAVPPLLRHLASRFADRRLPRAAFLRVLPKLVRFFPGVLRPRPGYLRDFVTAVFDETRDGPVYHRHSAWPVLERIRVPVCIGSNWGNVSIHLRGAFEAWHRLRARKWLFVGPPEAGWPWKSYQEELLAWYDHHLRGVDNGYDHLPPVRYWVMGADRWEAAEDWPVPGARTRRLYLAPAAGGEPDGVLAPGVPADRGSRAFLAVPPATPCPRGLARAEPEVLRYRTRPLENDLEVVGPVTLEVTLSSTAIDTTLVVRLGDEDPRGRFRSVDHSRSTPSEIVPDTSRAEPLEPGVPVPVRFSLNPTANRFRAGHRVVLEVASRPDRVAPRRSEGFVYFGWEAPPYPARNQVFHGGEAPSHLEVQVVHG